MLFTSLLFQGYPVNYLLIGHHLLEIASDAISCMQVFEALIDDKRLVLEYDVASRDLLTRANVRDHYIRMVTKKEETQGQAKILLVDIR